MPLIWKKPATSIIKLEGRDVVNAILLVMGAHDRNPSFILVASKLHDIVEPIYPRDAT